MALFNRTFDVTVGEPGSSRALLIKDLRVTFKVDKSAGPTTNMAELAIYNLSAASRKQMEGAGQKVRIEAGYAPGSGREKALIFLGDITKVTHSFEPPDIVTRITANDGKTSLTQTLVELTYGPKASALKALEDIVAAFKLPLRTPLNKLNVKDKPYPQGFQAPHHAMRAMSLVADRLGLDWSVLNGEIMLVKKHEADGSEVVLVTPDSGLIGRAEKLDVLDDDKTLTPEQKEGWKVNSLLLPRAEPGGRLAIRSKDVTQGVFRIEKVMHHGDTHGNDWRTEIEVMGRIG